MNRKHILTALIILTACCAAAQVIPVEKLANKKHVVKGRGGSNKPAGAGLWEQQFDADSDLMAVKQNGKWGFVDKSTSKIVIPLKYDKVDKVQAGNINVYINTPYGVKHGVLNTLGEVVIKPTLKNEDADSEYDFHEGLSRYLMKTTGIYRYGFITEDGRAVTPFIYDNTLVFSEGFVAVKKNNRWWFINKSGKLAVPSSYKEALSFKHGVAGVYNGTNWGLINKTGKLIVPYVSDGIDEDSDEKGRYILYIKGRHVIMNEKGNEIEQVN